MLAKTLSYGSYNAIGTFVFNIMAGIFKIPAKIFATESLLIAHVEKDSPTIANAFRVALQHLNTEFSVSTQYAK
jgi:hypothetical protein